MENKKINSLIGEIENSLRPIIEDDTTRKQYAWWTLESILKHNKLSLMVQENISLTNDQQTLIHTWIDKMVNEHMPIAYLIGSVPFCDVDILVEPPILIPRPETEEWTTNLIEKLQKLENKSLTILDLCSGSGCIALAMAKALPQSKIYAADISEKAIALGQKNALHNKITNITFMHSDLFNELDTATLFDIIVSNPPYISFDEFEELDASVSTWEDKQALVADDLGTAIIKDIIDQASDFLKNNNELITKKIPQVTIEIGYKQGTIVQDIMHTAGYKNVLVLKDLEGKDRVVTGNFINEVLEQAKA